MLIVKKPLIIKIIYEALILISFHLSQKQFLKLLSNAFLQKIQEEKEDFSLYLGRKIAKIKARHTAATSAKNENSAP
jgi:hypothetical protein